MDCETANSSFAEHATNTKDTSATADCPKRWTKKKERKVKMSEYSRKIVEGNKSGNQCG